MRTEGNVEDASDEEKTSLKNVKSVQRNDSLRKRSISIASEFDEQDEPYQAYMISNPIKIY